MLVSSVYIINIIGRNMLKNNIFKHSIKSIFAAGLTLFMLSNSYAVNMQYLRYSPVASFTQEDFELLQTTGGNALNNNEDGKTSEWKNPKSGNSGSITPFDSSTIDGNYCRKVKIINQTSTQSGQSTYTFCKVKSDWKVLK